MTDEEQMAREADWSAQRMRRLDGLQDRVLVLIRRSMLQKQMALINYDALNEYYGFQERLSCTATSSLVTLT